MIVEVKDGKVMMMMKSKLNKCLICGNPATFEKDSVNEGICLSCREVKNE